MVESDSLLLYLELEPFTGVILADTPTSCIHWFCNLRLRHPRLCRPQ